MDPSTESRRYRREGVPIRLLSTALVCLVASAPTILGEVVTLGHVGEYAPDGISVDRQGNVFAAGTRCCGFDEGRIFRITPEGERSVFALGFLTPSGNAFDAQGRFYQVNRGSWPGFPPESASIIRISPDGSREVFADRFDGPARLHGPSAITIDSQGTAYVANCWDDNVLRITQEREITVLYDATTEGLRTTNNNTCPSGLTLDDQGFLYLTNSSHPWIFRISPDGEAVQFAMTDDGPQPTNWPIYNHGITYVAGELYVGHTGNNQIYKVSVVDGSVELFAGSGEKGFDDGPNLEASFSLIDGATRNPAGDAIYVNMAGPPPGKERGALRVRKIDLRLPQPERPTRLTAQVRPANAVRVVLTWRDNGRREEGFLIEAQRAGESAFETVAVVPVNRRTVAVKGLRPSTDYVFAARAFNATSESAQSNRVRLRTPAGPYVEVGSPARNFGQVVVGAASALKPITVTNSGTRPLRVSDIAIRGADRSQFLRPQALDGCSGRSLKPGASCRFQVRFQAAEAGLQRAMAIVPSSDREVRVQLRGTGLSRD